MAYVTASELAYFIRSVLNRSGGAAPAFTDATSPTLTEVNMYIDIVAAEMDMTLGGLGYVQPFTNTGGSALTSTQSNFLKLVNAMGAGGLVWSSMAPSPVGPSVQRPGANNTLENRYRRLLESLGLNGGYGLRMEAYVGTAADRQFSTVLGPRTDYGEGLKDIRDSLDLWAMTELTELMQNYESGYRLPGLGPDFYAGNWVTVFGIPSPLVY